MKTVSTGRFAAPSVLIALFVLADLAPARAADKAASGSAIAERGVFGAWSLSCLKSAQPAGNGGCALSQIVAADPEGRKTILGVSIDQANAAAQPVMHFRFSPSALPDAGIGIKVDDGDPMRLAISDCDARRCEASGHLTGEVAARLKAGKMAQVAYFTQERKQVTVPLSLAGLGEGLAALAATARR